MRPRLSIFIATVLDGYIARADGSVNWLAIVHPVDEAHCTSFMSSVDTIVIGRLPIGEIFLQQSKSPAGILSVIACLFSPLFIRIVR